MFRDKNRVMAEVRGSARFPQLFGVVYFETCSRGVLITAQIYGLPAQDAENSGFFGFHIHDGVSCTGNAEDAFAGAKGHYNPSGKAHPYHAGDLPPLLSNNGYAYMTVLTNRFKLEDVIGKVIIIHDKPDDFRSQPSGDSGEKIACGKIYSYRVRR